MEMNNDIQIGDYVLLRGNCDYNCNVETKKPILLVCSSKYACDEKEFGTTLILEKLPFEQEVVTQSFSSDIGFL